MTIYARVYEHSPWIAETVWQAGLRAEHDEVEGLHASMSSVVDHASRDRQLALLNAHPDLAGRLAMRGELTRESTGEQASAGLDQCSPEEFVQFSKLNEVYKARFSFPFIMAVKGRSRAEILANFQKRIENDVETEFRTALSEVHKIALLRLRDL